MIDSTDKGRFSLQPMQQMPKIPLTPQQFPAMGMPDQPTQVAPEPMPEPEPVMRSVLQREGFSSEQNIRQLIDRLRGYQRPGMPPQQ